MKPFKRTLFLCAIVPFLVCSCSETEETTWRDNNIAFFESVKNKDDIKEIGDSINGYPGLYYLEYKTGTGRKPMIGETVKITYSVWYWNEGLTYNDDLDEDDAIDHNAVGSYFKVGTSTIEGISWALQNMTVGSKWRLFIPYYLAYGREGTTKIKPYSTLIFDLELLSIKDN